MGIDLGTTYSVVTHMRGSTPEAVLLEQGTALVPSVVAFDQVQTKRQLQREHAQAERRTRPVSAASDLQGQSLAGHAAKQQASTNLLNTFASIKVLMGQTDASSVPPELQSRARVEGRPAGPSLRSHVGPKPHVASKTL